MEYKTICRYLYGLYDDFSYIDMNIAEKEVE